MPEVKAVGHVQSRFAESADPFEMRRHESTIVVDRELAEGLFRIEEHRFLQVLFHMDRSRYTDPVTTVYHGGRKGVFACRTPNRPGAVGLTTVELLRREGRRLVVRGLDALDGTPVLDIKPYTREWDGLPATGDPDPAFLRTPRRELTPLVQTRDLEALLREAGRLHGHFCPGLALGVISATHGLHALAERLELRVAELLASDGLEELLAVVESNNCSVDGVQMVTGCTLGNNGLIYRDLGKTAVTVAVRSGIGIRLCARAGYREALEERVPGFGKLFDQVVRESSRDPDLVRKFKEAAREASFALLEVPAERLFSVSEVAVTVPRYAPMRSSVACALCGESVMEGKTVTRDGTACCRPCAGEPVAELSGAGITTRYEKETTA